MCSSLPLSSTPKIPFSIYFDENILPSVDLRPEYLEVIDLKKKELAGIEETDPKWLISLTEDLDRVKTRDGYDLVKNLFNDYLAEGMSPREAWEKAKKVAKSFKF